MHLLLFLVFHWVLFKYINIKSLYKLSAEIFLYNFFTCVSSSYLSSKESVTVAAPKLATLYVIMKRLHSVCVKRYCFVSILLFYCKKTRLHEYRAYFVKKLNYRHWLYRRHAPHKCLLIQLFLLLGLTTDACIKWELFKKQWISLDTQQDSNNRSAHKRRRPSRSRCIRHYTGRLYYRRMERGSFIRVKACVRRDVPLHLRCSEQPYKNGAVSLIYFEILCHLHSFYRIEWDEMVWKWSCPISVTCFSIETGENR